MHRFSPLPFLVEARKKITDPKDWLSDSYNWGIDASGLAVDFYYQPETAVRFSSKAAVMASMGNLMHIRTNIPDDLAKLLEDAGKKLFPNQYTRIPYLLEGLTHAETLALFDQAIEGWKDWKQCSTTRGGAFIQFRTSDYCTPTDYGTPAETHKGAWIMKAARPGEVRWLVAAQNEAQSFCTRAPQRRPLVFCQTSDFDVQL